jgi:acetolactate synthase I/II/III large subunit
VLKVNDYIAKRLVELGVTKVYGLVGGSTAGLNDGFINNKDLEFIAFHHEQGAGHAAVGSARTDNKISVCNVTAGCGVTNAMTSLLNAYEESAPVLFLSGNTAMANQAKYINRAKGIHIRKYGIQDLDAHRTVEHISKYAVAIERAEDVPYELDKAIDIALSGRPGPVWIDVPGNLQSANIPDDYKKYQTDDQDRNFNFGPYLDALDVIYKSERPLIVAGNGINLGRAREQFREFVDTHKIPFITTFLSRDLIEYQHPQNLGMMGIKGARAANFAMQNADCLIILGCSMNVTHIGYDSKTFSPASKKIMIDIDANELGKDIFKIDMPIVGDVKDFFHAEKTHRKDYIPKSWVDKCAYWKDKWPIYNPEVHRSDEGGLNLYEIVESINRNMEPKDCFVVDAGQPCYILSTNGKFTKDTRYMAQAAQGDMGYAIPASVGVHFADPSFNITIVIGEGSFYTNMQELAVIRQHNIPIKIFVINNDGYMSIKQTQDKFFGGRRWGVSNSTGVYFADIAKIADAFEIPYTKISHNNELDQQMEHIMKFKDGPIIVEFMSQHVLDVQPAQAIKPDGSQGGLHDMSPFLSPEELAAEMIIKI